MSDGTECQLLLLLAGVPLPHCKCVFSTSVFLQVTCYMLNVGVSKSHINETTRPGQRWTFVSDSMFKNSFQG